MAAALTALALGVLLVLVGIAGWRYDPRRLRPALTLLAGLPVTLLGLAATLSASGAVPGALRVVVAVALVGGGVAALVLTGFLLTNGVIMLRRERRTLAHLLTLIAGLGMLAVLLLVVLALTVAGTGSGAARVVRWAALVAGGLLGYVVFCFAGFLLGTLLYRRGARRFEPRYLVVLGAGLRDGRVSPLLARRLDRAVREFRRHGGRPVVVPSGGQGPDEPRAEAEAMTEHLLLQGVPADSIMPELRSRSTAENLRFSRALFDDPAARTLVVTSSFHVLRAAMITRTLGMRARVVGARTAGYYAPSAWLREFAALLVGHRVVHAVLIGSYLVAVGVGTVLLR